MLMHISCGFPIFLSSRTQTGSTFTVESRSDRGSPAVKVSYRGWPCHEFKPSTTKDPPNREKMHVKSVKRSNVVPLVW
ncbi:hypothetical protein TNCV_4022711 [Trichonephila clavipes]|nr:hypothetical protein TNCV_4022711 [Trichonephila clavipes]